VPVDREPPAPCREGDAGVAHVLITAWDENTAYRVFDALVERFPGVDPPVPWPAHPGLVAFRVRTPTLGSTRGRGPADPDRCPSSRPATSRPRP
jgi:hypothetical protein